MSWSIAISVALLNALITGALAVFASFFLMHALNISDREGGVGMAIIFYIGPLALAVGLLCGFVATWWTGTTEWSQFWKALGYASALPFTITLLVIAVQLMGRPVVPKINGQTLMLQAEMFIPTSLVAEELIRHPETRASLYAGDKDNQYITVDTAGITAVEGGFLIPLHGPLNTAAILRMLTFSPYTGGSLTLDLPLRSKPAQSDTGWTQPMPLRRGVLANGTYDQTMATARYRVVLNETEP